MQSGAVHPIGSIHNSGCSTEHPSGFFSSALTGKHIKQIAVRAQTPNNTFFIVPPFNGLII